MRRCTALICAAATAAGCGGGEDAAREPAGDDRAAVERTVQAYADALAQADGARACEQLTVARYLPDGIEIFAGMTVASVSIDGDRATATVEVDDERYASTGEHETELVREGDTWRIATLLAGDEGETRPFAECVGAGLRAFDAGEADPYWERVGAGGELPAP